MVGYDDAMVYQFMTLLYFQTIEFVNVQACSYLRKGKRETVLFCSIDACCTHHFHFRMKGVFRGDNSGKCLAIKMSVSFLEVSIIWVNLYMYSAIILG
jgi:hypothetical protein